MRWTVRIVIVFLFFSIGVGSYVMSERAIGFGDSDLDRSVRMGSNGGPYLAGGVPK